MPYITAEQRKSVAKRGPKTAGQCNYALSVAFAKHVEDKGLSYSSINHVLGTIKTVEYILTTGLRQVLSTRMSLEDPFLNKVLSIVKGYQDSGGSFGDTLGVLDAAGKEFYRRIAVPYEEEKCEANGDVYE